MLRISIIVPLNPVSRDIKCIVKVRNNLLKRRVPYFSNTYMSWRHISYLWKEISMGIYNSLSTVYISLIQFSILQVWAQLKLLMHNHQYQIINNFRWRNISKILWFHCSQNGSFNERPILLRRQTIIIAVIQISYIINHEDTLRSLIYINLKYICQYL